MTNNINETHSNQLRILQYNVAKSREITDSILNDKSTSQYTVLLLQEQYWSPYQKSSLLHQSWTLIEPITTGEHPPRTAIYINNKALTSEAFHQLNIPNSDITAISITHNEPHIKPTLLINLYNSQKDDITPFLCQHIPHYVNSSAYDNVIILGDFNLHHPLWNPQSYIKHDLQSNQIVDLFMGVNLRPLLPPGTITYPTNNRAGGTAIDLVWGNDKAEENLLKCHAISALNDHTSDHLPIEITLNLESKQLPPTNPPFNYAKTNWEFLKIKLNDYLPTLIDPSHTSAQELDNFAGDLVNAIHRAIEDTTPRKKPSPHSKRWWNGDLSNFRKEVNRARNRYRRTRDRVDEIEWQMMTTQYKREIKKAKEKQWREFVEEADERSIWTVKKYIDSPPSPHYISTINNATSNEDKMEEFRATFFPPPPPAILEDINNATYPLPAPCNAQITQFQIQSAINKLSPKKAPGPDEINNLALKKTYETTHRHLHALVQASITLGHFPAPFKNTTTIILRKPMKPDYTKPNAYRPIALENTLGKVIESVMMELLSYAAEAYNLLPPQHFGGRPGRTGEDAMLILTERIHHTWKEREIFSVVFMDVAGAFNNVHHQRLYHNMRKRRVPEFITKWTESFLKNRHTQLRFNGADSERIPTGAGVPQGSPISPILYLFYNADLLDIPGRRGQSLGFIDDIAYGVQGQTDEENVEALKEILEGAEEWRRRHGARFEEGKYVLMHFTRNSRRKTTAALDIAGTRIEPADDARYLGVIFDKQLRFKKHIQYIAKKGTKFSYAIARISNSAWGATFQQTRTLFTSVVAPRMDHAAIIWHRPAAQGNMHRPGQLSKLEGAQRTTMKAILGTFHTTATSTLEIESSLYPTHLRLRTKILKSLARMQTYPPTNPVHSCIQRAARSQSKVHTTTLEYMMTTFPQYNSPTIETIYPHPKPPWWTPPFKVNICGDKMAAKKRHDEAIHSPGTICIYTDGSGIDGHIGAAAYSPTTSNIKRQYLGAESEYNVYVAEVEAVKLAADIVQEIGETYEQCIIYFDSQAAANGLMKPSKQSGQQFLVSALEKIEAIKTLTPNITLIWIPGHMEIAGNEMADKAAKEAAKSRAADVNFTHKPLKSSRSNAINQAVKNDWHEAWKNEKDHAKLLRRITAKIQDHQESKKLYNTITNRTSLAQLARLRTGHCSLNQYLHRFGIEESPLCECGNGAIENVEHYLLHCPRYDRQRSKLRNKVGIGGMRTEKLLSYPEFINFTLRYVKETGRFTF